MLENMMNCENNRVRLMFRNIIVNKHDGIIYKIEVGTSYCRYNRGRYVLIYSQLRICNVN